MTSRRQPDEPRVEPGGVAVFVRNPWVLVGLVMLAALAIVWLVIQPLARHANDTDSVATVLYFERIVHGQRLESFFPTTPKPLLTVVFGLAWTLTGDWRILTVLTVLVAALAVGLAARLAGRLGGPAAAAIVVIGLLAWPDFQREAAHANSFVWGLALWLLAGVLMTADRPRPWLAGGALVLAGLVRTETIWLLGAALICVAYLALRAARGADRAALRTTLPLLLGGLAIPLACLHDFLLTGRPFYWLAVPAGYTATAYPGLEPESPLATVARELVHYRPAIALLLLALVGGLWLFISGRRAVALALGCLVGGVLLTLVVLAWRAVFISVRYYEEADAAILLAEAVGAARLIDWSLERTELPLGGTNGKPEGSGFSVVQPGARPASRRVLASVTVAAILAAGTVAVDVPHGSLDPQLTSPADAYTVLEAHISDLRPILEGAQGRDVTVAGVSYPVADPTSCRMFAPRALVPIMSVEMGTPLNALGDSQLSFRHGASEVLSPGQWVLHIAASDGAGGVYAPFEHSGQTSIDQNGHELLVVPVVVDPQAGFWLVRIEAPPPA
jgi:hypothetical protein